MTRQNPDNIPGIVVDTPSKYWLIPGLVIQWLIYMNPPRGLRAVIATRHAKSPLMTYVYSAIFWVAIGVFIIFLVIHNFQT